MYNLVDTTIGTGKRVLRMPLPPSSSLTVVLEFLIDAEATAAAWTGLVFMTMGFAINADGDGPSFTFWNDGQMDTGHITNNPTVGLPVMDPSTPFQVEIDWNTTLQVYVNGEEFFPTSTPEFESYLADNGTVSGLEFQLMFRNTNSGTYIGKLSFVEFYGTSNPTPASPSRHVLIKDMKVVETITEYEVPGTPYVPAVPGHYVYETQQVCGMVYQGAGHYENVRDPATGQYHLIWHPDGPGGNVAIWTCTTKQVPVYVPATPAKPATPGHSYTQSSFDNDFNLGWNSGARSDAIFVGDSKVEFKIGVSDVGAIVGMNIDDGTPVSFNGNTIDYGFYLSHGVARVIRNGVTDPAGGAFTYDSDTLFGVERVDDTITFSKDGGTTYTLSGAALTPGWLEASLYSAQDVVYEPKITSGAPDPTAQGATLDGVLSYMTARLTRGELTELDGVMVPMTASLVGGFLAPSYALFRGDISILSSYFTMLTGETATLDGVLRPMECLMADHPYGALSGAMHPVDGWLSALEPEGQASFGSTAGAVSTISTRQILIATFRSTGQLLGVFTTTVVESATLMGRAILGNTLTFTSTQQAVLWGIATTAALAQVPEGDVETWVINLDGGAYGSTQYQNFDYNSYAFIDGRYYAAALDGLVLLEGDSDDGEPVRAVVSLGKRSAGNSKKKTFQECYLGMSAAGNLFVKVIAEGREFIYKTRDFDAELQQQRVTFGKGLRTNYVTLEIYNEDGCDFELDTVEFIVADMTRKI